MTQRWPAPTACTPVHAEVAVPGSKSITNRALLLAALASGPSVLRGPLRSRDTELMADALRVLGVRVEDGPDGEWRVWPGELRGGGGVDCGLAGTVMRFVPPLAALARGVVRFDGDPRARERPLRTVLAALRDLGADVAGEGLPFEVRGTGVVPGGEVEVDASTSSQFVSGLLLSAARFERGAVVRHRGEPVPSLPHIEMTVAMLRDAGVRVDAVESHTWRVHPGPVEPLDLDVQPDLSNATPFLAAAAVTGGAVTVPRWPERTEQAGDAMRWILRDMGCAVDLSAGGLTVRGRGELAGVDADLHEVGELAPTVAALAALASTPSRLRGVAHLRGHETDRLAALARELTALGGDVAETTDGLVIRPRPLHGGTWHAYDDHRMATAGAVLGLRVPGIEVDDIGTTAKTLPDFPGLWERMRRAGARAGAG